MFLPAVIMTWLVVQHPSQFTLYIARRPRPQAVAMDQANQVKAVVAQVFLTVPTVQDCPQHYMRL